MFRAYLAERGSPDEPVVAYFMNWKGETFYSRNLVRQVQDNARMKDIAARPGRIWVLVERARFNNLKSTLGPAATLRIADRSTNKFWLVEVTDAGPAPPPAPPAVKP